MLVGATKRFLGLLSGKLPKTNSSLPNSYRPHVDTERPLAEDRDVIKAHLYVEEVVRGALERM
jgi:hypothetical protein